MRKRERLSVWISSLLLLLVSSSRAQDVSSNNPPGEYSYQNFSPSMAIIIVVLIAALFFMGFFSIYIRHCTDSSAIGTVRQLGASIRRRNAARGLDRAVLETFPTFLYSEVKDKKIGKGALECAVCLNEFDEDDSLRLIPRCDHVFHPECIDAWLESHVTCPVCRANLAEPGEPTTDTHPVLEDIADPPNRTNDEVSIQITDEPERAETVTVPPQPMDRNPSVNRARPPRSRSVRPRVWPKFPRSHSTGHSLVQPGQNVDRFTLRLPDDLRKKVMSRALNRTTSCGVGLPREGSARRGYRTGFGEGSSRGGRSVRRFDTAAKSDRWVFTMAPPFFSRAASVRSPRTAANDGEGSTSAKMPGGRTAVRMPSFKCLEPKGDETGLVAAADPTRPPV